MLFYINWQYIVPFRKVPSLCFYYKPFLANGFAQLSENNRTLIKKNLWACLKFNWRLRVHELLQEKLSTAFILFVDWNWLNKQISKLESLKEGHLKFLTGLMYSFSVS